MICAIEIDGIGAVGVPNAVTARVATGGSLTLTVSGTPPGTDEIGARVWVEGVTGVTSGYYTMTGRSGSTVVVASSLTLGAGASGGSVRIEDHFRLSDGVPEWVTGSSAQARWLVQLVDVSTTAGQRLPAWGGIAAVDGITVTVGGGATFGGQFGLLGQPYNEDVVGGTVVVAEDISATSTTLKTYLAAVYAGNSAVVPTTPRQPTLVEGEAIYVYQTASSATADGVTTWTQTAIRGVLRSRAAPHIRGVWCFGEVPSIVGRTTHVYRYTDTSATHDDAEELLVGVVEDWRRADGVKMAFNVGTDVLRAWGRDASPSSAAWKWVRGWPGFRLNSEFAITGTEGLTTLWQWAEVENTACRISDTFGFLQVTDQSSYPRLELADKDEIVALNRLFAFGSGGIGAWFLSVNYGGPDFSDALAEALFEMGTGAVNTTTDENGVAHLNATPIPFLMPFPALHVFMPDVWPVLGALRNAPMYDGLARVNPVDAILACACSTSGTGVHDYDTAPAELSFGIRNIDEASFLAVGATLQREGVIAGTVFARAAQSGEMRQWLEELCKTYALTLATDRRGYLRLIDLATFDVSTAIDLDETHLVWREGGLSVAYSADASRSLSSVAVEFDQPWQWTQVKERLVPSAWPNAFGGLGVTTVSVRPKFAAYVDDQSGQAFRDRWGRMMADGAGLVGTLKVQTIPDGWAGDIGDIVRISLPLQSSTAGETLTAYGRVTNLTRVIRGVDPESFDEATIAVYSRRVSANPRAWSSSALVKGGSTATTFNVHDNIYADGDGAYATDSASFSAGDNVWLWSSTFAPLCDTAGVVQSTTTSTIVLSAACKLAGADVTPGSGVIVTLSAQADQGSTTQARWAWILDDAPGYEWQS